MSSAILFLTLFSTTFANAAEGKVDATAYPPAAWSPYIVGALLGVLTWLTFYFSDKAVGASSFYATIAGFIGKVIAPSHTKSLSYFKENPPKVNWEFVFVFMTIVGAFIAAWTGGEFANRWVPQFWEDRFGQGTVMARGLVGFGGGVLMAFGARLAGGCTSGHGISGALQLNVGSWIAVVCFFIGGVALANLIYRF